jgi:hypothetical protein
MPESGGSANAQPPGSTAGDPAHAHTVCDVFVSHASQDAALADAVVAALEHHGLRCWIAPRDVVPGSLYADAIVRAISESRVLVLVLSESAVASTHVGKEIERASSKRHPVVTLRIDEAPLTPGLEYFLSESQWIDLTTEGRERAFSKLVDAVRSHLATASAGVPATAADWHTVGRRWAKWRQSWLAVGAVALLGAAIAYFLVYNFWK